MGRKRQITITGISKTSLNQKAYTKLIQHYYKGVNDITIHFDRRIADYGQHFFDKQKETHYIWISPKICSYTVNNEKWDLQKKETKGTLVQLNGYDSVCQIILVTLHELVHAQQYEKDKKRYQRERDTPDSTIKQPLLRYELTSIETEAQGWALIGFNKALQRYNNWCV
jgi:hypothetical protein